MAAPLFKPFTADEIELAFETRLVEDVERGLVREAAGLPVREVIKRELARVAGESEGTRVGSYAAYVLDHVERDTPTGRWRMSRLERRVGRAIPAVITTPPRRRLARAS